MKLKSIPSLCVGIRRLSICCGDHRRVLITLLLISVGAALQGCAPVFSDLQSARLVEQGHVEVTPAFSTVSFSDDSQTEHVQNNFGLQVGVGVNERFEVRGGYARIAISGDDAPGDDVPGVNVLGVGPKVGIIKDRVAAYLPIGFAFGEDIEASETWAIHPTLLFTIPANENIEINPSTKVLIPLQGEGDMLLAFNLGAGLSQDLRKWAIRPEVGTLINPGESGLFWSFSLGFSYTL